MKSAALDLPIEVNASSNFETKFATFTLMVLGFELSDPEEIDKKVLDKEVELISEELKNSGKNEDLIKKISTGKINKFKEENSLLTQDWVMEPKKKVKEILSEINNSSLIIREFVRFKIGE